ncbi:DNA polymerase III subunit gamma/tau [Pasteurella multocida]|uniref:DNA polymerase III subunit gamma/tau n=1 Tax=Pasteurella multocida TaxID=747 RepID=UPI0028E032BB|nr:DNA polymerase III subunit gamma/tau [Pasteurella multocida]MEB3457218.1 DNA polymerase III subunit gamma/tau [Pasteurella multocida]MEB3488053.1 DNA polymerase III subunit gamma/tau [Pasteurella multocida]MEB3490438.1 DNA polymerase III subunit gamma/tau [Pasteurella multocida]WRK08251.1 DNA polymerase III subunit gamma/tau [Pasteurella multocida]HDR0612545.1 DNA polymerase III subunit gamma/tau [Pasteurella multocida]
MSYQVLARKWRPKTFSEVVGQQHILTALSNGLKENRLHHAYLFSGTRGVGKTSIARLFAKGLNCVHGVTAEPCGECEHCKAIEQGNFIDLIEIDAASRTKVEDTRELLDNVQYKPVQGRYKVYLIDEVHMLSRHSFNALLKTLEEPPEYVKFLLATTDPQKLPITILSRCMQFHLKALEQQQIAQHLEFILTQEKIPFEFLALEKLAKAAQGSIRDSLSLTDQAIAMSNGNITLTVVQEMLGLLDDDQALDIIHALQQGQGEAVMKGVQAVAEKGGDWDELLRDIGENLHKIAMQQLLPSSQLDDTSRIGFLASHISPEDVQFFYQVMLTGRKELPYAPNRRIGVEMTLLRALAFHPKFVAVAPTHATPISEQDAGSSSARHIEVPVVSQNIKSQYKSQVKSTVAVPVQVSPPVEEKVQTHTQTEETETYSPAFDALAQIDKLDHLTISSKTEKKKPSFTSETLVQTATLQNEVATPTLTSLPVIDSKTDSLSRIKDKVTALSIQATSKATVSATTFKPIIPQAVSQTEPEEDEDEMNDNQLAETYRWEWRNPELAKIQEGIKPSALKQRLEQEITPELRAKVIDIARKQDFWTDCVESLDIQNLTKELALNCILLSHDGDEYHLGVRENKVHLHTTNAKQQLQQALSQLRQQAVSVVISPTDSENLTPTEWYRQTYKALREKAQQALQQDEKLQLFLQEFSAEIELSTVKPV